MVVAAMVFWGLGAVQGLVHNSDDFMDAMASVPLVSTMVVTMSG